MITLVEAINLALHYEMQKDARTVVLGEDVAVNGGVFRATDGLLKRFGSVRVLDTPLAEAMIAGISIGMSAYELKPIAEFQFMGFMYPAFEQIISHASRLRNRTRGKMSCPIVFRAPFGGGVHAPEHHSESMEALFAHIPGIRVVIPSSPLQAYGLLLAAIRSPDPVIFLEPLRLYRLFKQEVIDDGEEIPLDQAFILREGSDLTLISWGASLIESLEAASLLALENIQIEVIDLATVKPIDLMTILQSIEKTGRCVIVHEAPKSGGIGAELAAQICEHGFDLLKSPICRITGYDTVIPCGQLERKYIPSVNRITQTIKQCIISHETLLFT